MIDELDRQLIIALSQDGRISYSKLAENLGIEGITVTKRVEKMLKDDVITICAEPNPVKMGLKVMACIALDVEFLNLESVCEKLKSIPDISMIIATFGKYDVLAFAEYRDNDSLFKAVREHIPKIKGIKAVDTFLISRNKWSQPAASGADSAAGEPVELDDIDLKLIDELKVDGRVRFADLAGKYGISTATVSRRVNSLIKNDVIRISVFANPARLVPKVVAFLGLQVEPEKIDEVSSRLTGFPQVESAMMLTSGYNIIAIVVVPDLQSLYKFMVSEFAAIEGILNIETLIRAQLIKRTYFKSSIEDMLR